MNACTLLKGVDVCLQKEVRKDSWDWTVDFALEMLLMGQRWRRQLPRLLPAAAARLAGLLCKMDTLCDDSEDEWHDPSFVTLPIQASMDAAITLHHPRPGRRLACAGVQEMHAAA